MTKGQNTNRSKRKRRKRVGVWDSWQENSLYNQFKSYYITAATSKDQRGSLHHVPIDHSSPTTTTQHNETKRKNSPSISPRVTVLNSGINTSLLPCEASVSFCNAHFKQCFFLLFLFNSLPLTLRADGEEDLCLSLSHIGPAWSKSERREIMDNFLL